MPSTPASGAGAEMTAPAASSAGLAARREPEVAEVEAGERRGAADRRQARARHAGHLALLAVRASTRAGRPAGPPPPGRTPRGRRRARRAGRARARAYWKPPQVPSSGVPSSDARGRSRRAPRRRPRTACPGAPRARRPPPPPPRAGWAATRASTPAGMRASSASSSRWVRWREVPVAEDGDRAASRRGAYSRRAISGACHASKGSDWPCRAPAAVNAPRWSPACRPARGGSSPSSRCSGASRTSSSRSPSTTSRPRWSPSGGSSSPSPCCCPTPGTRARSAGWRRAGGSWSSTPSWRSRCRGR